MVELVVIEQTCQVHGTEERAADTDDPSGCETADRTGTHKEQDHTGDQRSKVGVEDSGEGVAVAGVDGLLHALAGTQLFLDTLIDQHVGVDGGTQ